MPAIAKEDLKIGVIHITDPAEAPDIHIHMIKVSWACSRT